MLKPHTSRSCACVMCCRTCALLAPIYILISRLFTCMLVFLVNIISMIGHISYMVLVICQSQYMFSLLEMLREVTLVWTCIYKVECALAYMIDNRCIAVSETRNGMVEFGKSSHWLDILWKYVSFFPKKKLNVLGFSQIWLNL